MLATQWMSKLRLMVSRPAKATLFATLLAVPFMTLGLADQASAATHKKHASKTSSGKASAGKSKHANAKTSRHVKTQVAKGKVPKSFTFKESPACMAAFTK